MKMQDLRIGDVVCFEHSEASIANQMTVINKTENEVTFFRPYVQLSDFIYTGGVIPYVGTEKFVAPIIRDTEFSLFGNIYRGKITLTPA